MDRIAGSNRWETAVKISQEGWTSAGTVVLANGRNYPDALAGVPYAHALNAPVLLTEADSLVAATKAEITRLGANKVIILGGTGVISAAVEDEIKGMGLEVERVSGADRFETAANVAKKLAPTGAETVVLAFGRGYADALAAGSYAAINGYPILLTEKNSIPEATKKAIEDLGVTKVIVVGGTGAIAANTVADLPGVTRVSGANREATSVALAKHFNLKNQKYFIATGDGFADAITGAVLAAKEGTGILLVRSSFPAVVGEFFSDATVTEVVIFGGTSAVSSALAADIQKNLISGIGGIVGWTTADEVSIAGKTVKPDDNFFKITGIAPGSYKAYFKGESMETKAFNVVVMKDRLTVVEGTYGDPIENEAIQGVVIDKETGAPLTVDVALEKWNKDKAKWEDGTGTIAEATGIFKLDDVEAGGKYRVTLSLVDADLAEVYRDKVFVVEFAKDEGVKDLGLIEMELVKPMTLSGVLKDAEGNVVEDADIVEFTALGVTLTADTDEDGKFEFADLTLPTGKYSISVALDVDHAVYTAEVAVTEGVNRIHNINLKYGYELSFSLRSGSAGVDLDLTNAEFKVAELKTLLTDDDLDDVYTTTLAPGTYTIVASGDYLITTKYTVKIVDGDFSIQQQITPAGAISVNVVHDAFVEILDKDGKVVDSANIAAAGTEVFGGLPVGAKYTVRASAEGKKTKHFKDEADILTIVANAAQPATAIDLADVDTQGQVSGYVRKADGYPADGATVTYFVNDVKEHEKGEKTTYSVGATGLYETGLLDPGVYDVVISFAGHENYLGSMTFKAGDNKQFVNYRLVAGGNAKLELVVKDKNGVLVDVSTLTLEDAYGNPVSLALATDGTKFTATGLPAGTYTLTRAEDTENAKLAEKIVITKGDTIKANYKLVAPASQHAVTLWVVDENYADVTEAKVIVGSTDVTHAGTGYYTVDLVNGTYTAEIYVAGYLYETVEFTVKDAAMVVPQVQLTPAK